MKTLRTANRLRGYSPLSRGWRIGCSHRQATIAEGRGQGTILAAVLRAPGGFTLLEMLVVVAIMAVVISTAVADLSGLMGRYRLNGAAREFAAVVEECRFRAISSNVEFALLLVESDSSPGNGDSRANRGRYEVRRGDPTTTPMTWRLTDDGVYDYFAGPNLRRGVSIEAWQPLHALPRHGLADAIIFSPRAHLANSASDFSGGVIRVVLRNKSASGVERRVIRIDRGGNSQIAAGG